MKIQYREGPAEIGLSLPQPGKKSRMVNVRRGDPVEVPDALASAMLAKHHPVRWERVTEKKPTPKVEKKGGDA